MIAPAAAPRPDWHLSGRAHLRTTIDAIAEFLLGRADLGQECDRIERAILIAQALLHGRGHLRMRQRPLPGRRWSMIALDHFRSFVALVLQLE